MKKLIYKQEAIDAFGDVHSLDYNAKAVQNKIKALPVIDAVEVVRCKDCVYFSSTKYIAGKCELRGDFMYLNDYCSYGVRRRSK